MEQSNKIQRSEVWEQIYKVVSKIPRKDVESDAADAPSVATELEELFLKLLPIHDVSNRRELLFTYHEWYLKWRSSVSHSGVEYSVDAFLSKQ